MAIWAVSSRRMAENADPRPVVDRLVERFAERSSPAPVQQTGSEDSAPLSPVVDTLGEVMGVGGAAGQDSAGGASGGALGDRASGQPGVTSDRTREPLLKGRVLVAGRPVSSQVRIEPPASPNGANNPLTLLRPVKQVTTRRADGAFQFDTLAAGPALARVSPLALNPALGFREVVWPLVVPPDAPAGGLEPIAFDLGGPARLTIEWTGPGTIQTVTLFHGLKSPKGAELTVVVMPGADPRRVEAVNLPAGPWRAEIIATPSEGSRERLTLTRPVMLDGTAPTIVRWR